MVSKTSYSKDIGGVTFIFYLLGSHFDIRKQPISDLKIHFFFCRRVVIASDVMQ